MRYSGQIVWHSGVDLRGLDIQTARFRIVPYDRNMGIYSATGDLHIDNNEAPVIVYVEMPLGEISGVCDV